MNKEILSCPVDQWTGFKAAVKADKWELSGNLLALLPSLLLVAPIVGYLCVLLRLPFGWGAWAVIAIGSVLLTIPIRRYFKISSWGESIGILLLLIGIVVGYASASISWEAGSPATAVWYKALNLVNGGHLYRAMPWLDSWIGAGVQPAAVYEQYGALVPDAQYTHGNLHFMGLPGGAWFFAWWGMIGRSLLFIGPLMLMLATGIIIHRLLHLAMPETDWPSRTLMSLLLVAMPIYLYFGRGMYPALYALPCYGMALLLLIKTEWGCGPYPALLIAALSLPILCGTDFILPFLLAVLLITWHKPAWGLALGVTGVLVFYGLSAAEPLWFGQVVGMPVWVQGIAFFALGFYLAGLLLYRFFSKENAENWSRSALVSILFYVGLLVAVFFLIKKNGMALSGFSALSLAYSGVVLLAGLFAFPSILKQRGWPLIFRTMVAGLFLSQLIFFRERPIYTIYAHYLPYIALLLPLLWLSFGLWVKRAQGWPRYLVLGALLVLVLAQGWGAQLVPASQGAGADMRAFARQTVAQGTDKDTAIAYDTVQDQALTPLIWYSGLAPAPIVQGGEMQILDAVARDYHYITGRSMDAYSAAGSLEYSYLPPRQDGLPDAEIARIPWTLLDRDDILQGVQKDWKLYPSLTWRMKGTDTGYADHIRCFGMGIPIDGPAYLLIEGAGDEAAGLLDKGLGVYVDGLPLSYEGQDMTGSVYCFALPDALGTLSSFDIYIDPLPGEAYAEGTTWETGLEIGEIRLASQYPGNLQ